MPHRRQHRVEREADEQRHHHSDRDGHAELEEEAADDAAHERDRDEHGHDRERGRHDGEPDLLGPLERRGAVVLAHRQVPHDVLAHDDRVVDQKADAQRQRHQRQEVEREPERVERDERRDDRERQRDPGDDRAAPRVQEQEDDQDGQEPALDDGRLDAVDTLLDLVGRRVDDADLDVRRQPVLELGDRLPDVAAGLDDVGVLRLAHVDRDRLAAVNAGVALELLLAVDDVRDLRQVDRATTLLRDDDAAELLGVLDLALDAHDRVGLAARQAPGRHVLVRVADRLDDLVDADAQRSQRVGLDLDEDLACEAPVDVDPRDAGQVLERLDDRLVGQRRELAQPGRRRQHGERDDRRVVLVVGADDQRILDVAREARAHRRDLVAQIVLIACGTFVDMRNSTNTWLEPSRVAEHALDARDLVDRVLDRLMTSFSTASGARPGRSS